MCTEGSLYMKIEKEVLGTFIYSTYERRTFSVHNTLSSKKNEKMSWLEESLCFNVRVSLVHIALSPSTYFDVKNSREG